MYKLQLKTIFMFNLIFFLFLGYFSLSYLSFAKQPDYSYLIVALFVFILSAFSIKVISTQFIELSCPPSHFLFWFYSALSIFFFVTFVSDAWELFSEPKYNREISILLGSFNILFLRILGVIWFVFSAYLQKESNVSSKFTSYFSFVLTFLVLSTAFYFGYLRNPNRIFHVAISNVNIIRIKISERTVFESSDPTAISKILNMFRMKWWNSISRNVCNCADLPILEMQREDGISSFEFTEEYLEGLDFPGHLQLTEDSQNNVRKFLTQLK